jgi:hypothetical protein
MEVSGVREEKQKKLKPETLRFVLRTPTLRAGSRFVLRTPTLRAGSQFVLRTPNPLGGAPVWCLECWSEKLTVNV